MIDSAGSGAGWSSQSGVVSTRSPSCTWACSPSSATSHQPGSIGLAARAEAHAGHALADVERLPEWG
ncbi:MAG: hypothetical protein IPN01_27305 [Deltaproteobacteria bacterium]|nr:hypothetical protein [Deltaproteobacteria bacterium]